MNFPKEDLSDIKQKINFPIGGYAPGWYIGKCCVCKEGFIGDKRATQCLPCGINTINESNKEASRRLRKVEKTLSDLRRILAVLQEPPQELKDQAQKHQQ